MDGLVPGFSLYFSMGSVSAKEYSQKKTKILLIAFACMLPERENSVKGNK